MSLTVVRLLFFQIGSSTLSKFDIYEVGKNSMSHIFSRIAHSQILN